MIFNLLKSGGGHRRIFSSFIVCLLTLPHLTSSILFSGWEVKHRTMGNSFERMECGQINLHWWWVERQPSLSSAECARKRCLLRLRFSMCARQCSLLCLCVCDFPILSFPYPLAYLFPLFPCDRPVIVTVGRLSQTD